MVNSIGTQVIQLAGFCWPVPVTRATAIRLFQDMGHSPSEIDAMVFGYAKRLNCEPLSYAEARENLPAECFVDA